MSEEAAGEVPQIGPMWVWLGRAIVLYLWVSLAVAVPVTIAVLFGWDKAEIGTDYVSWYYEPLWVWGFAATSVLFTIVPTIGILFLPAWLMRNSRHPVVFKALAIVLTWWLPLLRIVFMATLASGVHGVLTQVVFCCLLPLPKGSGRGQALPDAAGSAPGGTEVSGRG